MLDIAQGNEKPGQVGMHVLRVSKVICCEHTRHTAIYTLAGAKTVTL